MKKVRGFYIPGAPSAPEQAQVAVKRLRPASLRMIRRDLLRIDASDVELNSPRWSIENPERFSELKPTQYSFRLIEKYLRPFQGSQTSLYRMGR